MLALLENLPKETLSAQLGYGAVLMLLGMVTVFVFLVILIYVTKLMSKICGKMNKGTKASENTVNKNSQQKVNAGSDSDAAIAAAIVAAYDKSIS